MSTDTAWEPFGVPGEEYDQAPEHDGVRVLNVKLGGGKDAAVKDRAGTWLRNAMIALGALAVAAAVVSFDAQYRMVFAAKGVRFIAALEAGIPDVAAVVFASLGIALALHGKRAIRARALNVASVAASIGMNALAAGHGWRDAAIWVMPPVAYALASDTAIGVIRAYALAKARALDSALAEDETTPLAIVGGLLLWVLRLAMAPRSTLSGFRRWVIEECPTAPGRRQVAPTPNVAALPAASDTPGSAAITKPDRLLDGGSPPSAASPKPADPPKPARRRGPRGESKTSRFVALVEERHGELAGIDPAKVSRICSDLAPEVGLNTGSARSALLPLVRAAHAGGAS